MIISEATEYIKYYEMPIGELIEQACEITENHFGNGFEFCSLISAKTGKCCENCKYCAQSSHYRTDIYTHPLVSLEEVKKAALSARDSGATRFAIVTSGKTPSFEKNFSELLKMIELIENIEGLTSCASLGIINEQEAQMLKNAGLKRYHHNINTSKSYYDFICSTHSYQDRIDTVKLSQKHGLEVCCGAILGMGETREQRIEIALEIRDLKVESAPLNFLDPIAGTPLENYYDKINPEEILRTIAIYRIIMPNVGLRYAGGRLKRLSKEYQELGIKAGINSALIGNMLTTIGVTPEDDLDMISKSGKSLIK
jgi:biotin synthase